jgi:hypothetical protein
LNNTGSDVVAIGQNAGEANIGDNVVTLGNFAGQSNDGSNVIGIGSQAARNNTGNNVIALGNNAGISNPLAGMFIISNSSLPSYANWAAADAAISATGIAGNTYLFYNQATQSIGAVRL